MQVFRTLMLFSLSCYFMTSHAQPFYKFGQYLQIHTKIRTFDGRPSWLIVIRDVDHNQNIPYLYDFEYGENMWLAFTYGRNYLILASTLSFSPYSHDPWRTVKIHNFCNLESHGRIIRGKAIKVVLRGDLMPNRNRYRCHVSYHEGENFYFAKPLDP